MPNTYRVTLSDGRRVTLEADHEPTEADVLMAIGQQSKPAASMSAAAPGTALPDTADARHEAKWGMKPVLPEAVRTAMTDPLMRPTGVDAIDSLTSPLNLIMTSAGIVKPAAQMAFKGLTSLASTLSPEARSALVGMIGGYRARQGLEVAHALRTAASEIGPTSTAGYPRLTESPAPAAAEPVAPPSRPVPAPAEAPAPAPAARVSNPGTALQMAKDAFAKLGEAPRPAEASNAKEFIMRGVPPEQAVAQVMKNRPKAPLSPVEQLAQMPGVMTDAEARAALDARNARGRIKSPSAQTARERRGN